MLTFLAEHIGLIAVACIELAAAGILAGIAFDSHIKEKNRINLRGKNADPFRGTMCRDDEACVVVRVSDMLPVYASDNFKHITGLTLEDLQEDVTCLESQVKKYSSKKSFWQDFKGWDGIGELVSEVQLKNDEWIKVIVRRSDDGLYNISFFERTTELHRKLDEYEKRLQQEHEASESKTTFLSRMSHEIRTPMNGIMGMLSLTKAKLEPDSPAMQYIEKADELSEHLIALINDILDMSRIEAGKVELEKKPFSISALGNRLYDMFAENLNERGIAYSVNYENMTVDKVVGDELRISQVIINFLSNAVKFTSQGEVSVTFRQMMLHEGVIDLMVSVHDTGIGMAPEFINRIFRPFEQESISTAKEYGGTGLGMAITDNLVKIMGGEIVVQSQPGKGSDFFVYLHLPVFDESQENGQILPEKGTQAENEHEISSGSFSGRRILVAEDNEINAMISEEILKNMGADVELAENGQLAVDAFAGHEAGYYDFILMDIQMPVMDGRTATRTIRGMDRTDAQQIPIFGLSADAFVEDVRKSKESGMNGHFAKPVDFPALEKSIGEMLAENT